LRPPHEPHKTAHVNAKNDQASKLASKKSQKAATKVANKITKSSAKPSTKHAANSITHARGRSGTKASRIDWPQVDPVTGEDRVWWRNCGVFRAMHGTIISVNVNARPA